MTRAAIALTVVAASALPAAADDEAVVVFEPRRRAVLASQVTSRIVEGLREEGEPVEAGEVLFRLDATLFEANRDKAEARLANARAVLASLRERATIDLEGAEIVRARAVLDGARQRLAAKERLLADRTLAAAEVEEARTLVAVAQADLDIAEKKKAVHAVELARETETAGATCRLEEANLRAAGKDLAECTVAAPFAGRVAELLAQVHETVQPGQELVEVVDDRVLLARFLAPSAMLPRIRTGTRLSIRVEETGETVEGRIALVGALVDPASSTIQISVEVDNEGRGLRGGMRGTLSLSALTTGQ